LAQAYSTKIAVLKLVGSFFVAAPDRFLVAEPAVAARAGRA